jgi:hypothetical protein
VNKAIKNLNNMIWFAYIGLMLSYLLFINFKTPLMGEDYAFFIYTDSKGELVKNIIHKFVDFFNFKSSERFNQRIGDTLATLLLNLGNLLGIGKSLFNIMNSIVLFLFFLLIFFFSNCRIPYINSIKDLAVFSVIPVLFLICSFNISEIFFWCDGATNYLWAAVVLLATAIPYRKYLNNKEYTLRKSQIFGYVIVSYIAGFTNENSVPIIILLGGFLILRDFIKGGIKKIPIWLILSVLSMGIGYSILLFSSNTKRRTMVYRNLYNLPENITLKEIKINIKRVVNTFLSGNYRFVIIFFLSLFIFIFILKIFLIKIYGNKQKKLIVINNYNNLIKLLENLFLLLLSSISIIALFFAPYTEKRTFLFLQICIVLVIVRINYLSICIINLQKNKYLKFLPNILFCLLSIMFLYRLSAWSLDYSKFDRLRSESIKNQIAKGKTNIIAKIYPKEINKYLNSREDWIRDITNGGLSCYSRFHGAKNIIWKPYSYEEISTE